MKNKYLLLLLLVLVIKPLYAIDPFSLKGKTIIIPPRKDCHYYKTCSAVGYDNVYNVKVLKKGKFSKNNKLNLDVYGKEIYVEDVVFFDKQDKNRAVCLVVICDEQKVVLHFPLIVPPKNSQIYKDSKDYFDYDPYIFLGDSIIGGSFQTKTYWEQGYPFTVRLQLQDPHSLKLRVYDTDSIHEIDNIFNNQTFFTKPIQNFDKYCQKPLKYKGIVNQWDIPDFDYSQLLDIYTSKDNYSQWRVLLDFTNNEKHSYLDVYSHDMVIPEVDYIKLCKQRFYIYNSYIDELKNSYVGNIVHIQGEKDWAHNPTCYTNDSKGQIYSQSLQSGCYNFDRIDLCYTNNKDSLYYSYHGVLRSCDNNTELFCPINSLKRIQLELYSDYVDRIYQQEIDKQQEEQERIQKQQKEEREYHQMLVKKYGATNAKLIENGEVKIGFTKQMCIESWGEPDDINTTTTAYGIHEQWVYYDDYYWSFDMRCLYFDNGVLVTIQD